MNPNEQRERKTAIDQLKADLAKDLSASSDELNDIIQDAMLKFTTAQKEQERRITELLDLTKVHVDQRSAEVIRTMAKTSEFVRERTPLALPGWAGRWEKLKWLWQGNV